MMEGGGEGEGRMHCRCPFSLGERYGFHRLIKTNMKNFHSIFFQRFEEFWFVAGTFFQYLPPFLEKRRNPGGRRVYIASKALYGIKIKLIMDVEGRVREV